MRDSFRVRNIFFVRGIYVYCKEIFIGERYMSESKNGQGTVTLDSRKHLLVKGVKEVVSFDDGGAVLVTDCGELCVEGEGIRIHELSGILGGNGEVSVTGRIDALFYRADTAEKKRGWRSRLLGR